MDDNNFSITKGTTRDLVYRNTVGYSKMNQVNLEKRFVISIESNVFVDTLYMIYTILVPETSISLLNGAVLIKICDCVSFDVTAGGFDGY